MFYQEMRVGSAVVSGIIGASIVTGILIGNVLQPNFLPGTKTNSINVKAQEYSISSQSALDTALHGDIVTVKVISADGRLISEQTSHNIITSAGAIWFCVMQDRCESQITAPAITSANNPTWWVQFISGTPNSNEPTGADCTAPSGGGALAGQVSGSRCVTNFGAAPAQYQAGGSVLTVSAAAGTGQLRGVGTFDTTNNYVLSTRATVCSIVNDGTAPSSGTCQFTDTTPVLTNMSVGSITVNGLALASGSNSAVTAGALIIAESTISAVTLAPGDTISVSWTVVT
jgi:hypothetical protein